ncbi:putative exported protein [Halobacteriovorax marinus SJ]|uniref:Exported protein n=1 Tax=Halobacteriovorax marinus (strain ATCC BAA-682 / DSM 15412 / SJ) TaxID=862908 RepID=E1X0N9_HALMS|nr:hypothetical protein [Halobacteriovorax marinus]CBW26377.1 putative exported protein [Halobacteriovorax marinus SJ]
MRYIKALLILIALSSTTLAFDTTSEIEKLNTEFNQYQKYPIIIFNKDKIRSLLVEDKNQNIKSITLYMKETFNITIDHFEAESILDYHTVLNNSASALPFKEKRSKDYKFCAVFPSGAKTNHSEEVERILGIHDSLNPYPKDTVERVTELLTLKELKLFSLYHELSHCLDEKYIPDSFATDGHHIHMAESFAENLAALILTKRFEFRNIALKRSILRGLYTRYMGRHIIRDEDTIVMHPSAKQMGVVYYLSPTLIKLNDTLQSYDFRRGKQSMQELMAIAHSNVEEHAFSSRTFQAIAAYLKDGRENSLFRYRNFSASSPDLFYITYLRLRKEILFLDDLDFLLNSF